jgi:hypothetical protein
MDFRFRVESDRTADITAMTEFDKPVIRKHLRDLPMGVTDHAMEAWYHPSIA